MSVSLAGNGPLLALTRSYSLQGSEDYAGRSGYAFGDWIIALPRIETLAVLGSENSIRDGWMVDSPTGDAYQRCSYFSAPPDYTVQPGFTAPWEASEWWRGYHLIIPGQGSQDLLFSGDPDYHAVTKQHWRLSCLSSTANDEQGEAFLAQAPDGTTYTFNELVYRWAPSITRPAGDPLSNPETSSGFNPPSASSSAMTSAGMIGVGQGPQPNQINGDILKRSTAWMLVTHIEDRFGNTLDYKYDADGHLTDIRASDGRALSVQYVSGTARIQSVTLQPSSGAARTWSYSYDPTTHALTGVTQPDGSQWHYDFSAFDAASLTASGLHGCTVVGIPSQIDTTWTGTIIHPSGLVGTFSVNAIKHGQSGVPRECNGLVSANDTTSGYAVIPDAWYSFTLTQKTLSGPGLPRETWQYAYSPPNDSWSDCTGSCPTTVHTDVTNPDGSSVRYEFSNHYDDSDSRLISTKSYSGAVEASSLVRTETNAYAAYDAGPYPTSAGGVLQPNNVNVAQLTHYTPLKQRDLVQDGDTYTWQAEAFDEYTHVTKEKRSNDISGQVPFETTTTYLNDTTRWVLGLPEVTTNVTPNSVTPNDPHYGDVIRQNDYSGNDTLHYRWAFGQKVMTYVFYTATDGVQFAGQLKSFTDGRGNTTTLSGYMRGIPQTVSYPDSTSQSLDVDDFGQITAITDQAGSTTGYQYDAVGRLTEIDYPTGDAVTWLPTLFDYDYITYAERGIAGNHWRRTVRTGNARAVTYFDAELRPILADTYDSSDSGSHANVRTDYDWRGQPTFASWAQGGSPSLTSITQGISTTYDALGRTTQVSQPSELGTLTTTTQYLGGARVKVTAPNGGSSHATTTYQVFDQPDFSRPIQVEAPTGITQTIARDIYGKPLSLTQSGWYNGSVSLTKDYYYDTHQRLCRTYEPESGSTVLAYDAANNLAWSASGQTISSGCGSVSSAQRSTRTYDAMNRVTKINYPSGTYDVYFTYDAKGNVQTSTTHSVLWTYVYNHRNRVTSETLKVDGYTWPLATAYDSYGHVQSQTYPDNRVIDYAPDALGRPQQVGSYARYPDYLPDGTLQSFQFGDGAGYAIQQNARHLLGQIQYSHGAVQVEESYSYDKNGNLTQATDTLDGSRTRAMGYDALNRLTYASGLWGSSAWTYDPLNNLRTRIADGLTRTYVYDSTNRLTSILNGGTPIHSFLHDSRGNTIEKDNIQRVFDKANRLTEVPSIQSYRYDAAGRRVLIQTPSGSKTYAMYDHSGRFIMQYRVATTPTITDYLYLGSHWIGRIAHTTSDKVSYEYTDALDSPMARINTAGILERYDYRPYGVQIDGSMSNAGPGFTGHVNDPSTGLVYMQQRYYDAEVGAFQSVDPIRPTPGDVFNFGRYLYANNNPYRYTDPDGRCADRYEDGSCKVNVDPSVSGDEAQEEREATEAVLNRYDRKINDLKDSTVYSIRWVKHLPSANDMQSGQLTGKQIKNIWNNQHFTIVPANSITNGGLGATSPGQTNLSSNAAGAYGDYAERTGSPRSTGYSTLVFHELGHVTPFGLLDSINSNGARWDTAAGSQREARAQTYGKTLAGSVGAPFICTAVPSGCW